MGNEGYKKKDYREIYNEMQALVFGKIIPATDGNEGSVLCSLLEATARVIAEGYLHCKAGYSRYLDDLPESAFGLSRITGSKSKGKVIFYCEEIEEDGKKIYRKADSDILIKRGTEIASGSIIFITLHDGYVFKGNGESEPISAEAKEIGEAGNVPTGAITAILSSVSNRVYGVKNVKPFENGRGFESDIAFKKRFLHYLRGLQRTNRDGVIEAALKAKAHHVNVVNYAPPKIIQITTADNETYKMTDWKANEFKNEDGKEIYLANCIVYVCDKEGKCSSELLKDVREMLRGKGTTEEPGYTPCGIQIAVLPIQTVYSFRGTGHRLIIDVKSVLPDKDEASKKIKEVVLEFFRLFETGQSLIVSNLIVAIRALEWIKDVNIKSEQDEEKELIPPKIEDGQLMVVEKEDVMVTFK